MPQRVEAVGLHRLLEPRYVVGLQPPREVDGGGHVEVAVGVDQNLHLGPDGLAYRGNRVYAQRGPGRRDGAAPVAAVVGAHLVHERVGLQRGVSLRDAVPGLLCGNCGVAAVDVGVERHVVPDRAAEELVDGPVPSPCP